MSRGHFFVQFSFASRTTGQAKDGKEGLLEVYCNWAQRKLEYRISRFQVKLSHYTVTQPSLLAHSTNVLVIICPLRSH